MRIAGTCRNGQPPELAKPPLHPTPRPRSGPPSRKSHRILLQPNIDRKGASQTIVSNRSALSRGPENRQRLSHNHLATSIEAPQGVPLFSLLFTLSCLWAFGPSALSCAGGFPPQRPPDTMPRWRRVAGMLSMPPVAHPRRAAQPPAVTTVGAGLVPAHSHPKIGLHPSARAGRKTPQICDILSVTEWAAICGPDSGSETEILGPANQTWQERMSEPRQQIPSFQKIS